MTQNKKFAEEVLKNRHAHNIILPSKNRVYLFVDDLLELLFPHFYGEYEYFNAGEIAGKLALLERDLIKILLPQKQNLSNGIENIATSFFRELPHIYRHLWMDAKAICDGDPASQSIDEVIIAYPGFEAIYSYRIANAFYKLNVPVFPRIITEYAHKKTGIDIHPGAEIGNSFFIDHGTGIVIGETTVIGDNVKIYQGVSLGALSVSKKFANQKRHPTIEDNVILYSNATILGNNTIGHDSIIGGNVWLTESIPPYSIVYHKSQVHVRTQKSDDGAINFII